MKNTKRILSVALALVMIASFALIASSCNSTETSTNNSTSTKTYNVGICQLVTHDALDAATEGFQKALVDKLGEDKVNFDLQNASNDPNMCPTIINSFVSKKVDLIMANATASLQAASNATDDIPILGTSITEYGTALHLTDFNGTVGGNISGTSDLAPLTEQGDMLMELFPEAKKVGIIYCSAEPNSEYQVKVISEYLTGKGLTCTKYSFSDSNDIATIATNAAANSDVIYIPTDNTAASCTETIKPIVLEKKVPVIAGEEGICKGCGVASLSISYYDLGYKTGEMAAKILTGEADISEMAIEYAPATKKYNAEICKELGITVPEGYVAIETGE